MDPAGAGNYRPALDSSHRGTGPYLAVGRFDVTDRAGAPARVDVSADGSRINLVGIPFGDEPVTADWLLTVAPRWTGPALQSDVTWSVNGWPTAAVWEVAFNIDGALPAVGDPAVEARPTGDVTGMPALDDDHRRRALGGRRAPVGLGLARRQHLVRRRPRDGGLAAVVARRRPVLGARAVRGRHLAARRERASGGTWRSPTTAHAAINAVP